MTCREIMIVNPPVLHARDTVAAAVRGLLAHHVLSMAVVDDEGRYLGMFAKSRLFGLVLPTIVAMEEVLPNFATLSDLAFLPDNLDDMRARLRAVADRPVGDYADRTVPVLRPDSPLMASVMLLYRTRNFLPVVEERTDRLLGVVSTWDTLTKLAEGLV